MGTNLMDTLKNLVESPIRIEEAVINTKQGPNPFYFTQIWSGMSKKLTKSTYFCYTV